MNDSLIPPLIIVLLPMIFSNISHMLVVKYDLLAFFKVPVWAFGFGANKTWRGFLVLPIANAFFLTTIVKISGQPSHNPYLLGLVLGLAYMIFELPNSFLKRRLGIKSGEASDKFPMLFYLLDKADSTFGVLLVYFFWSDISLQAITLFFALSILIHITLSLLLFKLKLKSGF